MSGLRERQKEQRKEAILAAAMNLFDSNGYSSTTVEQIAASASVSPPTVFNYFGNKQEILFALVERAHRRGVDEARVQMATFDNAIDALCNLHAAITQRELEALPASIWRELMNFSFNTSVSAVMLALHQHLAREIAALLRELQDRGMLDASFDADFVAEFLNDYSALLFARLVQQDSPDCQAHAIQIRRVAEVVFSGLYPKNLIHKEIL